MHTTYNYIQTYIHTSTLTGFVTHEVLNTLLQFTDTITLSLSPRMTPLTPFLRVGGVGSIRATQYIICPQGGVPKPPVRLQNMKHDLENVQKKHGRNKCKIIRERLACGSASEKGNCVEAKNISSTENLNTEIFHKIKNVHKNRKYQYQKTIVCFSHTV